MVSRERGRPEPLPRYASGMLCEDDLALLRAAHNMEGREAGTWSRLPMAVSRVQQNV